MIETQKRLKNSIDRCDLIDSNANVIASAATCRDDRVKTPS